jgi:hypothetical protein
MEPSTSARARSNVDSARRRRSNGGTEYFHTFLGATLVAPGHKQVLPLPPEFIVPRDGAEKQDCERNAAKRWLARHSAAVGHVRPVYLGDDLFACQPIVAAIQDAGGNFILTCKPASHQTITEYLHRATREEHRENICKRGKRTTTVYRWLNAIPMRAAEDAIAVNWFSIEICNDKGKRTYHNSFLTDLTVCAVTVAELAACGRARWKIENETFNVLKTGGYNLGHGKETLANVLVTLNLLAFAFHTAAHLAILAWRAAVVARGPKYHFFEHLRIITAYVVLYQISKGLTLLGRVRRRDLAVGQDFRCKGIGDWSFEKDFERLRDASWVPGSSCQFTLTRTLTGRTVKPTAQPKR